MRTYLILHTYGCILYNVADLVHVNYHLFIYPIKICQLQVVIDYSLIEYTYTLLTDEDRNINVTQWRDRYVNVTQKRDRYVNVTQ